MTPPGFDVHPGRWVASGRDVVRVSGDLARTVDLLCGVLAGADGCWGSDGLGRAFFDGHDGGGFRESRDAVLTDLAGVVNVVRAMGLWLQDSGRVYAAADEASTVGLQVPGWVVDGRLGGGDLYRLPGVTGGLAKSDPAPVGLLWVVRLLELLVGGCEWPDGSEAQLGTMAQGWLGAKDALLSAANGLRGDAGAVTSDAGRGAESFGAFAAGVIQALEGLAEGCGQLAGSCDDLAKLKRAARMQFGLSCGFLAMTWALAASLSAVTFGGSLSAATATTEAEGWALRAFLLRLAGFVKPVTMGAWFGAGLDLSGQVSRIHYGAAKGFDGGEFWKSMGEGGVAGGVMGVGGRWLSGGAQTSLRGGLRQWTALSGARGVVGRWTVTGTLATLGNGAAQGVFEGGHVDWGQAAVFGFGMGGLEEAKLGGRQVAAWVRGSGGVTRVAGVRGTGGDPARTTTGPTTGTGDEGATGGGSGDGAAGGRPVVRTADLTAAADGVTRTRAAVTRTVVTETRTEVTGTDTAGEGGETGGTQPVRTGHPAGADVTTATVETTHVTVQHLTTVEVTTGHPVTAQATGEPTGPPVEVAAVVPGGQGLPAAHPIHTEPATEGAPGGLRPVAGLGGDVGGAGHVHGGDGRPPARGAEPVVPVAVPDLPAALAHRALVDARRAVAPEGLVLEDGSVRATDRNGRGVHIPHEALRRIEERLVRRAGEGTPIEQLRVVAAVELGSVLAGAGHRRPVAPALVALGRLGGDPARPGTTLRPDLHTDAARDVVERASRIAESQWAAARDAWRLGDEPPGSSVAAPGLHWADLSLREVASALAELRPSDFGRGVTGLTWSGDGTIRVATEYGPPREIRVVIADIPDAASALVPGKGGAPDELRIRPETVSRQAAEAAGMTPASIAEAGEVLPRILGDSISDAVRRTAETHARSDQGVIRRLASDVRSLMGDEGRVNQLINQHRYLTRTWLEATDPAELSRIEARIGQVGQELRTNGQTPPVPPWSSGYDRPPTARTELIERARALSDALRRDVTALRAQVAEHLAIAQRERVGSAAARVRGWEASDQQDHGAAERRREAEAEVETRFRAMQLHTRIAERHAEALEEALDAQNAYDAILLNLESGPEPRPGHVERMIAGAVAVHAEQARDSLAAYQAALDRALTPEGTDARPPAGTAEMPPAGTPVRPGGTDERLHVVIDADPVVVATAEPGTARNPIAELLAERPDARPPSWDAALAETPAAGTGLPGFGAGGVALPEPPREIRPPRYVETGALGETAVHEVRLPADAAAAAERWVAGLPRDVDPRISAAIRTWLTERLADGDRDVWTDLFQKGALLEVDGKVLYLKPSLLDYTHVTGPEGRGRHYSVSFGGREARQGASRSSDLEASGGEVKIVDNSDEYEGLALPELGIGTTRHSTHASGASVMSGRKTVSMHDFFETRFTFKVYEGGAEIPYGARVDDVSMVFPFPAELHREGPPAADDGPRVLPRREVTPDAARRLPDHRVVVTALDATPLAVEVQRRLLAAGVPAREVVRTVEELLSTVLNEQGLKNNSQWLLTSGSDSGHGLRVSAGILRMDRVDESGMPVTDARLRDDLGRHTTTTDGLQTGNALNLWFGLKLGVDNTVSKFFARFGFTLKIGPVHFVSTSHMDLPKVTLIRATEIIRYDAVSRMHVSTERAGSFDVDVRMELAVPADEAGRFERDLLGGPHGPALTQGERHHQADAADSAAGPGTAVRPVHGATPPAYRPHPEEPAMLAAGRGAGLGTVARLPRSERLVTEIRDALRAALPDLPEKLARQLENALDISFGRPALEGDFTHLLNGIDFLTSAGRYRIEVSAHGTLGERRGVEEYDLTVNERRLVGSGATTGLARLRNVHLVLAANLRLKLGHIFGIDFPKASLNGGAGASTRSAFVSGLTAYYRTETDGAVVAFERALGIGVDVRVTRGGKEVIRTSWQVDGATAEIAVPRQHVPARPVSVAEAGQVGRVETLDGPPDDVFHLNEPVGGVIRVGAVPELMIQAARAYADWAGLPVPQERRDVPPEIRDLFRPSYLEANLGSLMSPDGLTVRLPDRDGRQQAVRLRLGLTGLEHTASGPGVEYEHYRNANTRVQDGRGGSMSVAAQGQVGVRAGLHLHDDPAYEDKIVVDVGAAVNAARATSRSRATGAMDIARGTYGNDHPSHFYESGLWVEMTPIRWQGHTVEEGPAAGFSVNRIVDLVVPEQVARHLGLPGPAPHVPEVTDHRQYIAPELALSSGYVEHLDSAGVLPEVVAALRAQGVLFPGEERTASPLMEVLRARYDELVLAGNLVALGDGVTTWLPVKDAFGFTKYVGVRVSADVLTGEHTAERPDMKLMLRSERTSAETSGHQTTTGWSGRALLRYTRSTDFIGGTEAGLGLGRDSMNSRSEGTGVKEIDRVQTYDPSHEFTHPVQYRIEIAYSHEPPPGLEQLRNGVREVQRRIAMITGNDVGRFWETQRLITTRFVSGELRLIVPEHLTMHVAEREPVAGTGLVEGEAPRWTLPQEPFPVNAMLAEYASQVAVPAAELIGRWAPVAALPAELRPDVPRVSDLPAGYELNQPLGVALLDAANPRTVRAWLWKLLTHEYVVPVLGGGDMRVGLNVHFGEQIAATELMKERLYTQTTTSRGHGSGRDKHVNGLTGGSGGPLEGPQYIGGASGGRGSGLDRSSLVLNIRERNVEANVDYVYYRCAVSLVLHGKDGDLVMYVPSGLYVRFLPEEVAEIREAHPDFFV